MRYVDLTPFEVLYMGLIPDEWCKVLTPFGVRLVHHDYTSWCK